MSVLLETSAGDIVIDLLVDYSPKLCENFLKLCKVKYYNFSPVYNVQKNFSFQTGDPIGPEAKESDGGSSIWGLLDGPAKRTFTAELNPKLKHVERGTVSMATVQSTKDPDERVAGSQFIITLGDNLDYLDGKAAIFGKVVEGFDALEKVNDAFCDDKGRPLVDIRIKHTVVLDDPYDDPPGLVEPPESPLPTKAQLATVRIGDDDNLEEEGDAEAVEKQRREREARAQALTLEMVGDLPFAEVKPPENVLFVCKLNPVTTDEDLELIFSRFGKILSCEVIRDKRTGDSLQYSFIEYEDQTSCEQAYFKMQGVLIDDHRIHVDFSQSVSKLSDTWRTATNSKRRHRGGGFGGVSGLEKKRQYKLEEYSSGPRRDRYGMVYDEDELRRRHEREEKYDSSKRERSRSRSPQRERGDFDSRDDRRERDDWRDRGGGQERGRSDRDRFDDRRDDRRGRGGGRDRGRGDRDRFGDRDRDRRHG
ncbi:Peptidyl-prolyl cis-trans isomerase-like [Lachnellula hyalina]|uniref:Peptidyl-prolyl cis-trans isomerase n=1 Tax=Lachnellula hyalina TaxID=1316788 RepID=A0A8H8RA71_9HELO|nr:Peptidyl-prolyl cis-trans isomerase-like [Lachnellula hyalina]TVY29645.1 Peptidyl-prolyl cis-trans isomerase-like [Lachnellula hyalina]